MNFKFLLKSITLALCIPLAFADESEFKGDCKEIVDFFTERDASQSINGCEVNSKGKVIAVDIDNQYITEECVKKTASYNTIKKLHYTKFSSNPVNDPVYKIIPPEIANLTKLEEFSFSFQPYRPYARTGIADGNLKLPKSLKKLVISGISASQTNIDEISTLTNLEHLDLTYFNRPHEKFSFKPLETLKKISYLNLSNEGYFVLDDLPELVYKSAKVIKHIAINGHSLSKISDNFSKLKNVKYLDLSGNEIGSILGKLQKFTKLEYLDLRRNNIDEEIPEFINNFKNLNYIDLSENKNIKGKTLTNSKLETCVYDKIYKELCIANKDTKCLEKNNYSYSLCDGTNNTTTPDDDIPYSPDGQCGEGHGKCPNGQCCSKYGWCGFSDLHCAVADGCQLKFGKCNDSHSQAIDRCGPGHGQCQEGYCCSREGWCGKTDDFCSEFKGCQIEFGMCLHDPRGTEKPDNDDPKDNDKDNNDDPKDNDKDNNDDPKEGKDNELPYTPNGKCNSKDGRCRPGSCCSKYGWCGTGERYCGAGCQKEFGGCN